MAKGERAGPYLQISGVTKRFGDFTALQDISLEVHEGEFVCFLGPSGCGKTTLLRAIAGLDIQTQGTIVQNGRDISALPPSSRDFGIVFQSYALFPNLTVFKNTAYGLENTRVPADGVRTRVTELLELVGLSDQGHKYPAQLSGGQQQRVALARAMATSPGLLLLDEPLSALDARVRVHLRAEIKELQRRIGVTTVMVTHDQEEALTMADRIVVMNDGVIEQVGTPEEIYGRPRTAFVARFIGSTNFVPGTVVAPDRVRSGAMLLGCDTDGMPVGTAVAVGIRTEDIDAQDLRDDDDNVIDVAIKTLGFLGSFYRADLDSDAFGGHPINADFSVNLVRRKRLGVGSRLPVRLPPEFIRIFPAERP